MTKPLVDLEQVLEKLDSAMNTDDVGMPYEVYAQGVRRAHTQATRAILQHLISKSDNPPQSPWKGIDSAPRDGTAMLGWYDVGAYTVFYEPDGGGWYGDHHSAAHGNPKSAPTHWMPLPQGPEGSSK